MSDPATPATRLEALIAFALRRRIVRAFLRYQDAGGPMLADSVTYRALFSLFAGVFLGFSIAAIWLLAHPQAFEALVTTLERLVPGLIGAGGAIDPDELLAPVAFTIAGAFASLGLVGAALGAVGSMRSALRQISAARTEPTLFVWEILQKLWVAALVGLAFVLAAALSVFGSSALGWLLGRVGVG
ncbi:MAG TPA: YhjD/YihY/BrkB family envelope integrity protein, partial [Microbacteriaceae bacterium]|nr:YhjD/YihY/BrkB family envelope integrity protein [Microbacteriaceae bacterium]